MTENTELKILFSIKITKDIVISPQFKKRERFKNEKSKIKNKQGWNFIKILQYLLKIFCSEKGIIISAFLSFLDSLICFALTEEEISTTFSLVLSLLFVIFVSFVEGIGIPNFSFF